MDKKYSFDNIKLYIEEAFKRFLDGTNAGTAEERRKEDERKEVLRQCISTCFAGSEMERDYVKRFIYRVLTGHIEEFSVNYSKNNLNITPENYKLVFPWDQSYQLPTHVKFLLILYHWKETHGANSFDYIVEKYNINKIRDIHVMQGDVKIDRGVYFDARDVDAIFEGEKITVNYDLAMAVLVQMFYEESKGNGCIDELLYQNIDDIGIGLSGLQNDNDPPHLKGRRVRKAYTGAWIKHHGTLMFISFISFGSFENLKRVTMQLVEYDMHGSFSEYDGYKMGYGKDGSRRTAAIAPFAENAAGWIRKFTAKTLTNKQLIIGDENKLGIENYELLMEVEKAIVKGGATIPICGGMGAGKTTKLEALVEYIQNWFAIRMIESEFEAKIRWRYPEKNILTVQTPIITPEKAYEFSLRTSGDIYIVSEVRSDEMMVNITRTANRGGRSVMFTYHPNKPRATIVEIANSLIRQKLYTTLRDAMYTTLDVIKCCEYIDVDIEKQCRYYNIYEFVPLYIEMTDDFNQFEGDQAQKYFMQTIYDYFRRRTEDEFFTVVPIIEFDKENNRYKYVNTISDRFYNELYKRSSLDVERETLEKLFRPNRYIKRYLEKNKINIEDSSIEYLIEKLGLGIVAEIVDKEKVKQESLTGSQI